MNSGFYTELRDLVWSLVHKYGRAYPDDCTQIAWEEILKLKKKFDATKGIKFSSFAYKRVKFAIMDYSMSQKRRELIETDIIDYDYIPVSGGRLEDSIAYNDLLRVIKDPVDRKIVWDRLLGKYNTEICKELGTSRQAIDQRLAKCLKLVKQSSERKGQIQWLIK